MMVITLMESSLMVIARWRWWSAEKENARTRHFLLAAQTYVNLWTRRFAKFSKSRNKISREQRKMRLHSSEVGSELKFCT
jgi:hypothetical protein